MSKDGQIPIHETIDDEPHITVHPRGERTLLRVCTHGGVTVIGLDPPARDALIIELTECRRGDAPETGIPHPFYKPA